MQTTLLFLGLLTFPGNMLLGLGIMLASNEVPKIAGQFGLDSSVRINMMSVVHATTTAVNLTRSEMCIRDSTVPLQNGVCKIKGGDFFYAAANLLHILFRHYTSPVLF